MGRGSPEPDVQAASSMTGPAAIVIVSPDPGDTAALRVALRLLDRHAQLSGYRRHPLTAAHVLHATAPGDPGRTEIDTRDGDNHRAPMPDPMLLDPPAAAARVGVSERTLRRLTAAGRIQRLKIGARTYYTPEALTAFVADLDPDPHEETPHADRT